ncbi:TraR/DksA C4-type zinc finger protein [bacterium]|nr:TraR/DksA C4-type zinc finger protein [bacterium]
MRTREIERIKAKLVKMREEILSEIGRFEDNILHKNRKDNTGEVSSFTTHPADMGAETAEYEKAYLLASKENRLFKLITQAIERIENNSFGNCIECGAQIPLERLRAIPYSPYCVDCKEKLENGDYVF